MIFNYRDSKDLILQMKYHAEVSFYMDPSPHTKSYFLTGDSAVIDEVFGVGIDYVHNVNLARVYAGGAKALFDKVLTFRGDLSILCKIDSNERTATLFGR